MSAYRRRVFWGHSLAQALAKAARYHGVPVERLDYRLHEKRHGFVRLPRAVLVDIDPAQPLLPEDAVPSPRPPSPARAAKPTLQSAPARPAGDRRERPSEHPRMPREEVWDAPDEESIYAAAEAMRRLLQLSSLELEARVEALDGRLELTLAGADEERLARLGVAFLDELESLLPRAVMGLSGRHVRCRVEGVGLREAREEALRARAREAAERVRATGDEVALEPLNPAERRIVHLELREEDGLRTESMGRGFRKRVVVSPA